MQIILNMEAQSIAYFIENALHWVGQHQTLAWIGTVVFLFILLGKILKKDLADRVASKVFNEQNIY